ncbi:MAG: bis(5'-nucleosyl)-tetraphosphatase (symmetrical) YqeK [Syntrophomonas sp.]|nr:bis(5'-nucleosyl)-tetraphosphatase (symmetrical) YqeK [Syntrophomonas sp.]
MIEATDAIQIVHGRLSERRFQHSLNVAQLAAELAVSFGVDSEKAFLVGILHDYAKDLTADELLLIGEDNGLIDNEVERHAPDLLHAPVGALLLEKELGIKDSEILEAVRAHTLGSVNMSILDKIIFLADMIEPDRNAYPDLERLRQLSRCNLDQAMLLGLDSTIRYCLDRQMILHPRTVTVRNTFLQKVAKL